MAFRSAKKSAVDSPETRDAVTSELATGDVSSGDVSSHDVPARVEHPRGSRWSRVLDVTGKTLVITGVMLLLFTAYQLWGTSLREQREQSSLAESFDQMVTATTTSSQATTSSTASPAVSPVKLSTGDVLGRIEIPSLKVSKYVVVGVDTASLKKGPGLFPESPLPGEKGNVALAGHRTTYGAPFSDLDRLTPGDEIFLTTASGRHRYVVDEDPFVVEPTAVEVVETKDPTKSQLTLVTCTPRFSAAQRLIVTATLRDAPVAPPATTPVVIEAASTGEVLSEGWFHDMSGLPVVLAAGTLLTLMYVVAGRLARRFSRWIVWPVASIPLAVVLFIFFEYLTRLLPAKI